MIGIGCRHSWEKWSGAIQSYSGSNHQVRRCEKCGAIKRRLICSIAAAHLQPGQINAALDKPAETK